MPDEDKTFSGSFVLDLRIWWRQVHTLYSLDLTILQFSYVLNFFVHHDDFQAATNSCLPTEEPLLIKE